MLEVPQFVLDRAAAEKPIFTADEVDRWPEGMFAFLESHDLIRETDNASSVVCDACGHDHVEPVVKLPLPDGTGFRGYIVCNIEGRIPVPLRRLRQWMLNVPKLSEMAGWPPPQKGEAHVDSLDLPADALTTALAAKPDNGDGNGGTKRRGKQSPTKRSWTQPDLDDAIRTFKAERASVYGDLVAGVKAGKTGAARSARKVFGRNAIVRALGVKAPAMVSNSSVWREIADELRLGGSRKTVGSSAGKRIGMEIAIEETAIEACEPVLDKVVQEETISLVNRTMPKAEAEATIEKLMRGEMSDDQARELTDVFAAQSQDARTHKVRQTP